tara:strand:- start:1101 stop:2342 length:1242 start_codon:yes stop_codon:yes gene_type:complete
MANTTLTADIIAKAAVLQLDNNLVMAKSVFRGYEEEFSKSVNGYEVGSSINVKRPMDFTVRDGAVQSAQDVTEGEFTLSINKRKGIDFEFTSQELTLDIKELSNRVIKPAMIQLANQIDTDLMALYKDVSNWVGTPGQTIDSNQDFSHGPRRLDQNAVPQDGRSAVLSPVDHWGLIGAQTTLTNDRLVGEAYTRGALGSIGGVETFMSQNVPTHTVGVGTGTPLVNGADQNVTYATSKDTNTQTIITDGWTNSTTAIVKAGDVLKFAGCFAVNPVTKATLSHLKEFVVTADANSGASTGPATITISPAMIISGAHQNASAVPANNAAITLKGTGAGLYPMNMMFTKNAFALVSVPLVSPPGAVDVSRQSYKGTHCRVIPVYDGTNDKSTWRLDVLYGVKCIDERQAVRVSGTS